ncbi:MAG: exodeoxyribonuclease VII small subunit [Eggerthellaceae bacterium]
MMNQEQCPQGGKVQEAKDFAQMSFREGMAELDRIVANLETNSMELEESLCAYEHGVKLLRELRGRLTSAEQRVVQLMEELEDVPADSEIDGGLSKA